MKAAIIAIAVSMMAVASAQAQERTMLPEIIVGAPPTSPPPPGQAGPSHGAGTAPAAAGKHQGCADVPSGGERSLGCLNEKLKRQVDQVNPVQNIPPIDAKSSDLKVGVVNIPGVQQQYGKNFGVSAVPYRPAAPVFASPVGRR